MKKYLIILSAMTCTLLAGCNSGNSTGGTTAPLSSNMTEQSATSHLASAADGIESYPMGNILQLNTGTTTIKPDNNQGILGFYLSNGIGVTATEKAAGKGALTVLIPNAEKTAFSSTKSVLNSGDHPELGNPLAPKNVKDRGLDYQAFGWQLSQTGMDSGLHNVFFKYNDPTTGENTYFKVVSKTVTASDGEIDSAMQKISNVVQSKSSNGLGIDFTNGWLWAGIACIAITIVLLATGGLAELGFIAISESTAMVSGSVGAIFMIPSAAAILGFFIGGYDAPTLNNSALKIASDSSYTYRQLRVEAVTASDVTTYPELALHASKAVTNFGGTVLSQRVGFVDANDKSGVASYYVDLSSVDNYLNSKTTHKRNPNNPNDLSYLREDGYLGNRMPVIDAKTGVVTQTNHFLDAAMALKIMPAQVNSLNGYMFDAFNQVAAESGYKSNAFINASPAVSVTSVSNTAVNATSNSSLANEYVLEHGLSYKDKNGVTAYSAISLQPGDKLTLNVQNPALNTAMLNSNGSEIKYANLSMLVADSDNNTGVLSALSTSQLTSERPLLLQAQGCENLAPGKSCSLSLELAKLSSESSFSGSLYLSDATSKITIVPFTYNISKVLSPSVINTMPGKGSAEGKFMNTGKTSFKQLTLSNGNLPEEASSALNCYDAAGTALTDSQPDLPAGGYCKVKLSGLDEIETGVYHLQIMSKGNIFQDVPVQVN